MEWQPVLITAGGTVVLGFLGYLGVRFTGRSAANVTRTMDSATWERRYRHNAERHLRWDLEMVSRLQRVEQKLGINEPISDPPPLFPDADAD